MPGVTDHMKMLLFHHPYSIQRVYLTIIDLVTFNKIAYRWYDNIFVLLNISQIINM